MASLPTTLLSIAVLLAGALPAAAEEALPGLRLREVGGVERRAPVLDMEVALRVTGPITRARVVQRFRNDGTSWVEGVYVFPLPERAAVDALRLRVGDRSFEGRIAEKQAARRSYTRSRKLGSHAALVEQERANLFTTSIANIGPGEEVEIELEYQELLRFADGRFELHVPLALTPRYVAGEPLVPAALQPAGLVGPTAAVPDAHRVTPPLREGRAGGAADATVTVSVDLDAGLPVRSIESPSHFLPDDIATDPHGRARIVLHALPADRDFVLRWWPRGGREARAAVFTEAFQGSHYVLAWILPPEPDRVTRVLSRELVLVIDTSGSMAGESLRQARAALQHALGSLSRDDYFNVIRFDNHFEPLFPESRPADVVSVHSAARFVRSLEAHGGTEMSGALDAALADPGLPVAVRQVVFVTDGAVADEARLFQQIEQQLGRTRLFPIGIGSAPNRHFLTRAARFGRGVTVAIARQSEVEQRIDELLDKIERPVLTGLEVHGNDPVEMWPARLPDLHAGEPLIVSARLPRLVGAIDLSAQRSDRPWTLSLPLAPAQEERGVAKLWARRKIAALMDARRRGEAPQTTRAAIVEVALRHGLVSRFTSLVAQDVTPARPSHAALSRRPVPTPLGRSEARFAEIGTLAGGGVLPAGATPSPFLLVAGIVCCLLSALGLRGQGGGRS